MSGDELLAEIRSGADEWEQAVADAERDRQPAPGVTGQKKNRRPVLRRDARRPSSKRAGGQVRYIAHREEGLRSGKRPKLHAIGELYLGFRGDERAIRRALMDDAASSGIRSTSASSSPSTTTRPSALPALTGAWRSAGCATPHRTSLVHGPRPGGIEPSIS